MDQLTWDTPELGAASRYRELVQAARRAAWGALGSGAYVMVAAVGLSLFGTSEPVMLPLWTAGGLLLLHAVQFWVRNRWLFFSQALVLLLRL